MERALWPERLRKRFFSELMARAGLTWKEIAARVQVHPRTLSDWRRGRSRISRQTLTYLAQHFNIRHNLPAEFVDDKAERVIAGRKGGFARLRAHGPPGTADGRRRGGLMAMARMRLRGEARFKFTKKIRRPQLSAKLAEFVGIVMGDGGITHSQIVISGCESTDFDYKEHILVLGKQLFHLDGRSSLCKDQDCWTIVFSSTKLCLFLNQLGLPIGNKIRQRLDFPDWVLRNEKMLQACIRGLFDTDGSIYLDRHNIRGRQYRNINLSITTKSIDLLQSLFENLKLFGYSPTLSGDKNVLLRRREEIARFFMDIKPNNNKHRSRYRFFLHYRGEVG